MLPKPDPSIPDDPGSFIELERQYDDNMLRWKRGQDDDEEERTLTMKYQIHEKELGDEESGVSMGNVSTIWNCSFAQNLETNITTNKHLAEIKTRNNFMDDRMGKHLILSWWVRQGKTHYAR